MSTAVEQEWAARARDPRLDLWLRVHAYASAHATGSGHCRLTVGELRRGVDASLDRSQVSRAIARAVAVGWLHPASSARCLVLAGGEVPDPDCPASHR